MNTAAAPCDPLASGESPLPEAPLPDGALAVMQNALTSPYDRGMERMPLALGPADDGAFPVLPYDFGAYERRYGRPPESPAYLLAPAVNLAAPRTVRVSFRRDRTAPREHVDVTVPAGHRAGRALAVPVPVGLGDGLRLVSLRPLDPVPSARGPAWQVTALLGTMARLLWVIGAEHEEVADQIRDVAAQRDTSTAHGISLDLLGLDLGAPRFPPRPYSPDRDTIALFHLDELPPLGADGLPVAGAKVPEVLDSAPGAKDRRGTNLRARAGRTGRFSYAFAFGPGTSEIRVEHSPAFELPATASFTIEALVRPERVTTTGAVVAKRTPLTTTAGVGWALTVGTFRGIERNLRFSLSDGVQDIELFADLDLGDGAFRHVAGVLDREGTTATALLYVDGAEVARQVTGVAPVGEDAPEGQEAAAAEGQEATAIAATAPLGALTSTAPLVMGLGKELQGGRSVDAPYRGLLDEVRLSRVARHTFEPVTGESDDQYRRRLRIFHRWLLPTPEGLQAAVNKAAGPIPSAEDDCAPFVVLEQSEPVVTGGLSLRVLPAAIPVSQSVTADGESGVPEEEAVGTAAQDEPDFDPAWLLTHPDRPGLAFAGGDDSRSMQVGVQDALDTLVDRLTELTGDGGGTLRVLRGYVPATATASEPASAEDDAPDARVSAGLHSVGRAVLLAYENAVPARSVQVTAGELAAHAHAAGFDWVRHTREGHVYAAVRRGHPLRITGGPARAERALPDVTEGGRLELGIEPDPSSLSGAEVRWTVIRSGAGDAVFQPDAPGTLHAVSAGDVSVGVEVTLRGHVATGTRRIRIGLTDTSLKPGRTISGTGLRGISVGAAVGPPREDFAPDAQRVRTDDVTRPRHPVAYGTEPGRRLMQQVTGAVLDRLLALLAESPGVLTVLKAYEPIPAAKTRTTTGTRTGTARAKPPSIALLHAQGRALLLRHDTLTASALAARAFAAGFDYIGIESSREAPQSADVRVAMAAGEQLTVRGPRELTVGNSAAVGVAPSAKPSAACFSSDGRYVFLADPGTHRVIPLSVTAPSPGDFPRVALGASRRVAPFPHALAFGGGHLFVAHLHRDRISVLLPETLADAPLPEISCPGPSALAADADRLYVGCRGDNTLRAFALSTGQPAAPLALPAAPRSLAVAAGSPSLYVLVDGGRWCRVRRDPLAVEETVDIGDPTARTVAVTANGKKLYVLCRGGADGPRVLVFRTTTQAPPAVIDGFPDGTTPVALLMDGASRVLYVATRGPASAAARVYLVDVARDVLLPAFFTPGLGGPALATSPSGAAYRNCLVMAPRHSGAALLADPAPVASAPPGPPRLAAEIPLGTGAGEEFMWSFLPEAHGAADPSSSGAPLCRVTGVAPGRILVRGTYLPVEGLRPYQCEIALRPDLERKVASLRGPVVTKEQYDLILNVLNWFHPLGVECRTERLRALAGIGAEEAEPLPVHTFPTYHITDPLSSPLLRLRGGGRGVDAKDEQDD
ncbi:LamG-like jellyroll fold domain-containing protein [Streptomyces virginiae]|uniref:LamG-like jellyroll fold domain-containing protein n=1 Tax=Streptomyces virginiae TaxID=1961 RepID=UPI0036D039A3